jgi:NADH-quinone oxidoreductase subunit G
MSIRNLSLKDISNFSGIDSLPKKNEIFTPKPASIIFDEKIKIKDIDYYFSNSISRASKTMSDCRNIFDNNKKNGTIN